MISRDVSVGVTVEFKKDLPDWRVVSGQTAKVVEFKRSTPQKIKLELDDGRQISYFFSLLKDSMQLSQSDKDKLDNDSSEDSSTQLKVHEELALVLKSDASLYFKGNKGYFEAGKNKMVNSLCVTGQLSARKKIKNMQALNGVISSINNVLSDKVSSNYEKNDMQRHYYLNASPDSRAAYYFEGDSGIEVADLKLLEVRKYNLRTKKLAQSPVNFDLYTAAQRGILSFELSANFGVAVSKLVMAMLKDGKEKEFKYFVSIGLKEVDKFKDLSSVYRDYLDVIEEEKENFSKAVKNCGVARSGMKSNYYYTLGAAAFKSIEDRQKFLETFKSDRSVAKELGMTEILEHKNIVRNEHLNNVLISNLFKELSTTIPQASVADGQEMAKEDKKVRKI